MQAPTLQLEAIVRDRRILNAGLYIALTQKCPMSCGHCSTNSSLASPLVPHEDDLRRFVASTDKGPPRYVLFTGGEPLLRPNLLRELAGVARSHGSRVYVITGGFWARKPSPAISRALECVDLLTFSYDRFHSPEVSIEDLIHAMRTVEALGISLAVQSVRDPLQPAYTDLILGAIGQAFDGRVPVYVSTLAYHGRAGSLPQAEPTLIHHDAPCTVSAWPVVSYTGAIVACCQHVVIDSLDPPPHLLLGKLGSSDWQHVTSTNRDRIALRAVRTLGPAGLNAPQGSYCRPCLSFTADREDAIRDRFARADGEVQERLLQIPGLLPSVELQRPVAHG